MTPPDPGRVPEQAARHDPIYDELYASADFTELRRRYRAFVVPATIGFLVWYLLYVLMSNWADGFMAHKVVGNINVALIFGLLQFVTTFLIAYAYARYSAKKLDPLAEKLHDEFEADAASREVR